MLTAQGRFAGAKIFTDDVPRNTYSQIIQLLNMPYMEGARIRFMPDAHPGAGCVIGTTIDVSGGRPVCPNLVGCDIGCGMLAVHLESSDIDLPELDRVIREHVPAGAKKSARMDPMADGFDMDLRANLSVPARQKAMSSLGTLGGGNHFIEIDKAEDGTAYLVIHSGSRSLGIAVWRYYMAKAEHGSTGRYPGVYIPDELAFLDGEVLQDYLHDMRVTQEFASLNRKSIADKILDRAGLKQTGRFETVHNYIDLDRGILRKGAISARKGETVLIPLSMADGALLCTGKGDPDWNFSAPHGAGRKLSRSEASSQLDMNEYRDRMAGIYTTCVSESTLDESPMAYKDPEGILANIADAVDVVCHLKPVYNFKAGRQN